MKKTPVELVLEVLTKQQLADAAGLDLTSVYYWSDTSRREGGYIPSRYIPRVFEYLKAHNIPFSLEKLVGLPPRQRSGRKLPKAITKVQRHDENV
jgi:hypothetical protein